MRGSGIYSQDLTLNTTCPDCEQEVEVEATTNDWQTMAYGRCPVCESELEISLDTED